MRNMEMCGRGESLPGRWDGKQTAGVGGCRNRRVSVMKSSFVSMENHATRGYLLKHEGKACKPVVRPTE